MKLSRSWNAIFLNTIKNAILSEVSSNFKTVPYILFLFFKTFP